MPKPFDFLKGWEIVAVFFVLFCFFFNTPKFVLNWNRAKCVFRIVGLLISVSNIKVFILFG